MKKATQKQSTVSSSKPPQTMEDLLSGSGITVTSLKRGDHVTAKILKVGKREIIADIGAKSYGIIVGREYELTGDMKTMLSEGQVVTAEVIIPEMDDGETLISVRRTLTVQLWNDLVEAKKNKTELSVTPIRGISSGLLVDCKSLRGFVPQQQLDPKYQQNPDKLVGKNIMVRVLEVDRSQNRLILSQKEVTQKEELAARRAAVHAFKVGSKVTATITDVGNYALEVLVKKGKIEANGFVHISEISWERVDNLTSLYTVGDTITAQIASVDEQEGALALSMKQLEKDPWDSVAEKYPEESSVSGKIVKVTSLGAFVELEKGVEGLIHVSKMPAGAEFTEGAKVPVTVDKLDIKNRKISLTYTSVTKPIGYR